MSAPSGPPVRKLGPHRRGSDLPASPGSTSAERRRGAGGGHSAAGGPWAQDAVPHERGPRSPQLSCAHGDLRELKLPLHKRSLKDIGN